ncbi:MAG: pirin family protein [Actinobacteria bacterium]|uniref:Unannotated protein n=1 Tax=freshwater metagenome TaxID=449393 RepID=A0A6J7C8D7_9ZZZZ|nr:pirin family protein [Actinomycetota bacterium]MSW78923.1 pirin family protein [Actinomycetota bacterium]MSX56953.1 pirin family protein [Actinomycetota bacterium]MSX92861.1 pirin family protein [Actinomycetota bacterium]MSZ83808.1 pirin family protein [Actinomycetota bacterium]
MRTLTIQRADERFVTDAGWLYSLHNFNFGRHYHDNNQGHGLLLVSNDDVVAPGHGFGTHGHSDMEIVTWVLSGRLEHHDSEGNHSVLYPGLGQRMSAGAGIRHSEMNASPDEAVHFVQMWLSPDTNGVQPSYEQHDFNDQLSAGGLVAIASGQGHEGALSLQQKGAALWAVRLKAAETVAISASPHVHVFVALGSGALVGVCELDTGDAVRLTYRREGHGDGLSFVAGMEGAELLIWATD